MPNDAKLGFLVGVAGVVVAAVLFVQNQPPEELPAQAVGAVKASRGEESARKDQEPAAVATVAPTPASRNTMPAVAVSVQGRKEVVGVPVSRVNTDDE